MAEVAESSPPAPSRVRAEDVLGAFQGDLPAHVVPARYRVGLVLVAIGMVVLPIIYVGLIGLAAWGVWYHATHHTGLVVGGGRRSRGGSQGSLLLYLTPIAVGVILIVFMVKPLLARRPKAAEPRRLDPGNQPLLF